MRLGVTGLDCQRRSIGRLGLGQLALLAKDVAQVVVRLEVIGLQPQGLPVGGERIVEPAQVPQGVGQIVVDFRRVGQKLRGRAEFGDRFVEPFQGTQRVTAVVVGVAPARLQFHGLLEAGHRFFELLHAGPGNAEMLYSLASHRPPRRPLQPSAGRLRILACSAKTPSRCSASAFGIGLQDLAIERFRLPPVSRFVKSACFDQFLHGCFPSAEQVEVALECHSSAPNLPRLYRASRHIGKTPCSRASHACQRTGRIPLALSIDQPRSVGIE